MSGKAISPGKKPKRARSARPTLMQVAQATGLSPSTISAVLNQRPHCWASEKTRKQIEEAAQELGYRPNLVARSLRGGKTQTVGLITAAMNVDTTAEKVSSFEAAARQAGYVTMIAFNPNDPAVEDKLILALWDRAIDGVLIYPSEQGPHQQMRRLLREHVPLVTVDGAGRLDFPTDDISTDYHQAGRMQAQHLLKLGRRRLSQAMALPSCFVVEQLRAGVLEASSAAGAQPPVLLNLDLPADVGSVITPELLGQLRSFLVAQRGKIDGFISHDQVAAAAVHVAVKLGIRIPEELAIIGFDNSQAARNCLIPLTTVGQRSDEVGRLSFEILAQRMQGKANTPRQVLIEPELVIRESSGG